MGSRVPFSFARFYASCPITAPSSLYPYVSNHYYIWTNSLSISHAFMLSFRLLCNKLAADTRPGTTGLPNVFFRIKSPKFNLQWVWVWQLS